jgi:hypothetical protein
MITLLKPSIRGHGVLFFGGLLESRGAYEILVSEKNGAPRILAISPERSKSHIAMGQRP